MTALTYTVQLTYVSAVKPRLTLTATPRDFQGAENFDEESHCPDSCKRELQVKLIHTTNILNASKSPTEHSINLSLFCKLTKTSRLSSMKKDSSPTPILPGHTDLSRFPILSHSFLNLHFTHFKVLST